MSKIDKILIPTDFSSASHNAIDYALAFVENDTSTEITLVHSTVESESSEEVSEKMEALKAKVSDSSKSLCDCIIKTGNLTGSIVETQKKLGSDLIIMGTKGSQDKDASTHTADLVLEADCPVLVIPDTFKNFSIKKVALALGKNEIDDSFALGVLHSIARKFDAEIHILTIDNSDSEAESSKDKNEDILDYYFETLDYKSVLPKNSDIEKGIEDYVNDHNIDLLAILPRNHAKKSTPSEGRLTKLLTLHSQIPLLTID
ncbi:MAG: universal stress protein [Bacteroidota bacterium]